MAIHALRHRGMHAMAIISRELSVLAAMAITLLHARNTSAMAIAAFESETRTMAITPCDETRPAM